MMHNSMLTAHMRDLANGLIQVISDEAAEAIADKWVSTSERGNVMRSVVVGVPPRKFSLAIVSAAEYFRDIADSPVEKTELSALIQWAKAWQ